jgi:hypothetical protein
MFTALLLLLRKNAEEGIEESTKTQNASGF